MAIFDPPQNPHHLTDHEKICHRRLHRRPLRLCRTWCKSVHGWLWANEWNVTKFLFIYLYLSWELTYRSDTSTDSCLMAQMTRTRLSGVCWYYLPYWVYMNFKNTRWLMAAILKTVKSPYLCNQWSEFDEIWHDDENWPHTADIWRTLVNYCRTTVKISNSLKSKMETAAILKITKKIISKQQFVWYLWNLACWCILVPRTWHKVKFSISDNLTCRPSVLWRCWLGGRKGIRPVKNWVVGCWCGYLSGARCRLAYGPADATATHCLLLQ